MKKSRSRRKRKNERITWNKIRKKKRSIKIKSLE
jgi:hypothetical protein